MDDARFDTLTPAERSVLRVALGRTNDEVATELGVSRGTVAAHMLSARKKLGSPPRGEATRLFHDWETSRQKQPRQKTPMVVQHPVEEEKQAEATTVHDTRTPFIVLDEVAPVSMPLDAGKEPRRHERILMILVTAVLIMACFEYLPGLRASAHGLEGGVDRILNLVGAKRSD